MSVSKIDAKAWREKPPSWTALLTGLAAGAGVIGLLIFGASHLWQRSALVAQRIGTEWLNPYVSTLRAAPTEQSWQS